MATEIRTPKASDGQRLLVVDDDREIRDLLSALLTRRGYKVVTAREEHEMRQILGSSRVDLIILDLMLPGKDGLTICRELRATRAIPIIMLTSRGEPMDRIVGLEDNRIIRAVKNLSLGEEYLADHLHEAPVWIVPCLSGPRGSGASIFPAVLVAG